MQSLHPSYDEIYIDLENRDRRSMLEKEELRDPEQQIEVKLTLSRYSVGQLLEGLPGLNPPN